MSITKCCRCGREMRHNVPRLGDAGGFVHTHSGKLLCGDIEKSLPEPQIYLTKTEIPTELWIVGKHVNGSMVNAQAWEFQGVFSSEEKALAACLNNSFFIAPATLDEQLPLDTQEWNGLYYPYVEDKS